MPIAHSPSTGVSAPTSSPLLSLLMSVNYTNLTISDVGPILQQQNQILQSLVQIQTQQSDQIDDLVKALDTSWTLTSAYLVFIMQLGFALLEAGSVRAMNTKNILMQNIMDTGISIIMFWLIGYGIASSNGASNNMGIGDMAFIAVSSHIQYPNFIFLWSFNNAATTIVSGAVTSRIKFSAYMVSCVVVSGLVFPMVAYWCWGYGFIGINNPNGWKVIDFAGGLVVHVVGGCSGLMGVIVLGAREGRFAKDEHGKPVPKEPGHSIVLATIGMFLLWFGWFGFNSGSTQAMANGRHLVAGQAAVNSLVAAGAAMIIMCIWSIVEDKVHDSWELLNGILCGLVAVTPAVATVEPWAAIVIGVVSVPVYRVMARVIAHFEIDDVVDAFALHGANGIWGCIGTALFSTQANIDLAFGPGAVVYNRAHQVGIHIAAALVVVSFTCAVMGITFWVMHKTVGIRVSLADERVGLDFKYHAGYAYPDFNVRVKRAKEQMQLEAEIGNAVRREMAAGRGSRFKEAAGSGQTFSFPQSHGDRHKSDGEISMSGGGHMSQQHARGASVLRESMGNRTTHAGSSVVISTGTVTSALGSGAVMGTAGSRNFIRTGSVASSHVKVQSPETRWANTTRASVASSVELPSVHTNQDPDLEMGTSGGSPGSPAAGWRSLNDPNPDPSRRATSPEARYRETSP